jgi:plasmid stabilization system protein ParE
VDAAFDFLEARVAGRSVRRPRARAWRAFALLAEHPLLGREAEDGRRELFLSRGKFGYVAKYRWVPSDDVVLILEFAISWKRATKRSRAVADMLSPAAEDDFDLSNSRGRGVLRMTGRWRP